MKEKIYLFNKGSKTLHIKHLCKNAHGSDLIAYYTEQEAIKDNGRYIHMCMECDEEKEKILQREVKKLG